MESLSLSLSSTRTVTEPALSLFHSIIRNRNQERKPFDLTFDLGVGDGRDLDPENMTEEGKGQRSFPKFWPNTPDSIDRNRKFRSQSAKPSASTSSLQGKSKTAHDESDWMKVLEERSGSAKRSRSRSRSRPPVRGQLAGHGGDFDLKPDPPGPDVLRGEVDLEEEEERSSFVTDSSFPFPDRHLFTGESSEGGTSIGWAEDAMEHESTSLLAREWGKIEALFHAHVLATPPRPLEMTEETYAEVLLWRRAFPHKIDPEKGEQAERLAMKTEIDEDEMLSTQAVPSRPLSSVTIKADPDEDSAFDLFCLPPSPAKGHSFLENWLDNLTISDDRVSVKGQDLDRGQGDHYSTGAESFDVDSEEFSLKSLPSQPTSSVRKIKVQRPISSQYFRKGFQKHGNFDLDPESRSRGEVKGQSYQNEAQSIPEAGVGRSKLNGLARSRSINSASFKPWSRYTLKETEGQGQISTSKSSGQNTSSIRGRSTNQRSFMNWLLFDENEENS